MTLRNSLITKIWSAIEKSPFTPSDFDVSFGDSDNSLLSIKFRHHLSYYLAVAENYSGEIILSVAPGEHKKAEAVKLNSLAEIPESVTEWARNVRDELRSAIPVYSELDELRDTIERHVAEHIENPESPFSQEEADSLREKLNELMTSFQGMQQRSEMTEQELNRLSQELTSIKANLTAYPRGVWYKTAANKLWSTVSKIATSQESRQLMAQAAKKLLGFDSVVP